VLGKEVMSKDLKGADIKLTEKQIEENNKKLV
jgi:hypothetical protein